MSALYTDTKFAPVVGKALANSQTPTRLLTYSPSAVRWGRKKEKKNRNEKACGLRKRQGVETGDKHQLL